MKESLKEKIRSAISLQPPWVFVFYATITAFLTYTCLYSFRKTFSVATFDNQYFLGVHYKIWLITSQLIGYMLAKFIGIKLISEMTPNKRAKYILLISGMALMALLLFAITPPPYNIIWMFFNGMPLALGWGLVVSYLEGRRTTELLSAGVGVSFIFASGFVKSVGKYLMVEYGVTELWMPFVAGMLFVVPLLIFVWLMDMMPYPNAEDIASRTERQPMNSNERKSFLKQFIYIIIPIVFIYIALSILRDVRDNYAAEIWNELGYSNTPGIFAKAEIPVGIGVLIIVALMVVFKNNLRALNISLLLIGLGLVINILATFAFKAHMISGALWMIVVGFGLYLGYIVYHALLFERFLASFKQIGNIGFLFYIADSIAYVGSVSTFLIKNFFSPNISWVSFLENLNWSLSLIGVVLCIVAYFLITKKHKNMVRA